VPTGAFPVAVALPLGVRNRLAELILEAFDEPAARATLEALASFCQGRLPDPEAASRLVDLGWFEATGSGRVRLLGAHHAHRAALCHRATVAVALLDDPATPGAGTLAGLLGRAARLGDARLYFEVHELLEPRWMRAEGAERLALQGLIQVAVALHHAEQSNRPGAISLMGEGLAKLDAAGAALPLDTVEWRKALTACLAAWRLNLPAPGLPLWPAPAATTRSGHRE
jgi:uncharacterized protein